MKEKIILFAILFFNLFNLHAQDLEMSVATVDSGFGGFFTAKALEKEAIELHQNFQLKFLINHFGDTLNAPYGEKTPDEIAHHAANIIVKAHLKGAKHVFLACNTASSVFDKILKILANDSKTREFTKNTYSIINSSVENLKNKILNLTKTTQKDIHIALLVTPATLKSDIYPKSLQESFQITDIKKSSVVNFEQLRWRNIKSKNIQSAFSKVIFSIDNNLKQKIHIYQIAPGNWVEFIEYQAPVNFVEENISKDLKLLTEKISSDVKFSVVAEFCTHFPVFHKQIVDNLYKLNRIDTKTTEYIQQGEIFAKIFNKMVVADYNDKKRSKKLLLSKNSSKIFEPNIYITGNNKMETENLVKSIFPDQENVSVTITK